MNGKQFNNLVKTMNALKPGAVPLKAEITIVDGDRVAMMTVRDPTGAPVFGVEAEEMGLDISKLPTIPDEEFDASVDTVRMRYVLQNAETRYTMANTDVSNRSPKVPPLDGLETGTVPAKTLQNAVKGLKGVSDHATFEARDGRLTMGVESAGTEITKVLAECDGDFRTMLPWDYMERVAKVTVGDVRMEFATDYPSRWTWTDGRYEYTALLAPRIESN